MEWNESHFHNHLTPVTAFLEAPYNPAYTWMHFQSAAYLKRPELSRFFPFFLWTPKKITSYVLIMVYNSCHMLLWLYLFPHAQIRVISGSIRPRRTPAAGRRWRLNGEATAPPLGQKIVAHLRTITIKHTAIFHYNLLYSTTACLLNKEM